MNTLRHRDVAAFATLSVVATEAQDIAQVSADYRRARGVRRQSLQETISKKVDDLLEMLLSGFGGTLSHAEAMPLIEEHRPLTPVALAKIPESAVPLVVMRELITVHQSPIDYRRLKHWSAFARRFQSAIV